MSQKKFKQARQAEKKLFKKVVEPYLETRVKEIAKKYDGKISIIWYVGSTIFLVTIASILLNLYYYVEKTCS